MQGVDCVRANRLPREKRQRFFLACLLLFAFATAAAAQGAKTTAPATTMPTTEIFMNTLGTCAAGMHLQITAKLNGSVKEFYEGHKTEGSAWLENAPDLLKLFPDSDKIVAYRLYLDCILKIVGAPKEQANAPKKETCVSTFLKCAADLKKKDKSSAESCKRYAECDPDNAKAHISLAEALTAANNPTAATESIKKAQALEPNNTAVMAWSYEQQAVTAIEQRRYDDAQRYVMMSIEYDTKANNRIRVGRDYATLGYIEMHLKHVSSARRAFEKSLELLQPTNDKSSLARSYRFYGRALVRIGEKPRGCSYLLKARALYATTDNPRGLDVVEHGLDYFAC